ncbi:MAG: hypothetical protein ABIS20_14165 [Thermoanaerobaculia bacterium]
MRNRSVLAVLVVSLLLGLSPLAADPVIRHGIDIFATTADGTTSYDFAQSPIPADFFCKGSKAFTSRVALKGLPLATGTPGQLWNTDTVIERLDDAAFDANGVAVTRMRMRALSLVSIAPIKTACGSFHVYVSLGGKQRVTTMNIYRTQEGGGNFVAPLAVNARLTFIPVKPGRNKAARKLALDGSFTFPASPLPWSVADGAMAKRIGSVVVDTDGDLVPDTSLPSTSNFSPGSLPDRRTLSKGIGEYDCPCWDGQLTCHTDPSTGKEHCTTPPRPDYCELRLCGPTAE